MTAAAVVPTASVAAVCPCFSDHTMATTETSAFQFRIRNTRCTRCRRKAHTTAMATDTAHTTATDTAARGRSHQQDEYDIGNDYGVLVWYVSTFFRKIFFSTNLLLGVFWVADHEYDISFALSYHLITFLIILSLKT